MKLIAIDLDGTLLNDQGRVSLYTKEVIKQVQQAGHKVVIATGRHVQSALPIAEQLHLTDALVCFNGALVLNLQNRKPEVAHTYWHHDIYHIAKLVSDWGYSYYTATKERYYVEAKYQHIIDDFQAKGIALRKISHIEDVMDPIFKMTIVGSEREVNQVERFIYPTVKSLQVIRSGETAIDIVSPLATKGAAIAWLAERYGIEQKNVMAFGNYNNDISMLKYAGIGVAVENAPGQVIEHADHVCLSNEDDGVAHYLEEYVLAKSFGLIAVNV